MNILEEIVEVKKQEVAALKRDFTLSRFEDSQFFDQKNLGFKKSLSSNNVISIIAEIKKASPSKGIIKSDFNHIDIAELYMEFGANAVSVLTDQNFFKGNITYLNDIAKIKSVPLLRKDFIINEFQVFEAKSNGADAVLLISEILSESQIKELSFCAKELGLFALLELHSVKQISKIDFGLNDIIGINNRNLENFKTDLNTTLEIEKLLPEDIVVVAESGISNREDFDLLKTGKTDAVLVGEHLMRSNSIGDSLKQMKEWCRREN
ncbi:MAG: indole-3-glycerol phosphate synthase TrpC [Melioribacteraceae bacterium]|nr:indole-3-glycerol phosphate synthase TrpC [Melioribacteraceae bacterium]